MLFPREEQWQSWGITEDIHKFFYLRWQELFFERTFDSWQVRSSNIRSVLKEVLDTAEIVKDYHIYHPNIPILINEAEKIIGKDLIIKRYFPYMQEYLGKLSNSYKNDIRNLEKSNISKFITLSKIILSYLEKYSEKLKNEIVNLISSSPRRYKRDLEPLIMALAVDLLSKGYSLNSLRDSCSFLTPNDGTSFVERLIKFMSYFNMEEKKFEVRFFIQWPSKLFEFVDYEINIVNDRPFPLLSEEETVFYNQDKEEKIAIVKVKALDAYCARYAAEEILQGFFAINMFYQVSKTARSKHPIALVQTQDEVFNVEPDTSRLKYIKDTNKPDLNISALADVLKRLNSQDSGKILASLKYHKLALNTQIDEARLINLWVALETLTKNEEITIIESICSYVPKAIAIGYIYRISRAIPISISKLWQNSNTDELLQLLENSNEYKLHPIDMLKILFEKNDSDLITRFQNIVGQHPLLHYRIFSLREDLFKNPKKLKNGIERHRRDVDWQIRRIYRARNHIVHTGTCLPQNRQLIQHLHSYFIITTHALIHDLRNNQLWGIADAFEHRRNMYDYFITRLKNSDPTISIDEIYNPLDMFLAKSDLKPAWLNKE